MHTHSSARYCLLSTAALGPVTLRSRPQHANKTTLWRLHRLSFTVKTFKIKEVNLEKQRQEYLIAKRHTPGNAQQQRLVLLGSKSTHKDKLLVNWQRLWYQHNSLSTSNALKWKASRNSDINGCNITWFHHWCYAWPWLCFWITVMWLWCKPVRRSSTFQLYCRL